MRDGTNNNLPQISAGVWESETKRFGGGGGGRIGFKPDKIPEGESRLRMVASTKLVPSPDGKTQLPYLTDRVSHLVETAKGWVGGLCPDRHGGVFCKVCTAHSRLPDNHDLKQFGGNPISRNNEGLFIDENEGKLHNYRFPDTLRKAIAQQGKLAAQMRTPGDILNPYDGYSLSVTYSPKATVKYTASLIPEKCPVFENPDRTPNVAMIDKVMATRIDLNVRGRLREEDFQGVDKVMDALPDLAEMLSPRELAFDYAKAWKDYEATMASQADDNDHGEGDDYAHDEDEPPPVPTTAAAAAAVPPPPSVHKATPRVQPPPAQRVTEHVATIPKAAPPPVPQSTAPVARPPGIPRPGGIPRPPSTPVTPPPARTAVAAVERMRHPDSDPGAPPPDTSDDDIPF